MNKPNPDADLLRRAATQVRETANAATEGPWKTHDTHLGSGGHSATLLTHRDKLTDTGLVAWLPTFSHEPWNDNTNAWADATHIALWHPGVALAVAEWLDNCAAAASEWCNSAPPGAAARDPELHQESFASMYHYPLAVARALLGKDA